MAVQGLWPERLLPTTFIFVAPPAVIGLAVLQLGAPALMGWMAWGMALFLLLWAGSLVRRILAHPFAIPFWGMSFPLAAFSALTLRLAAGGPAWFQNVAVMLLALTSLVIAGLLLATFRGLRNGSLLEPEPVAPIVVAA
jgi:tellurite resistance protein